MIHKISKQSELPVVGDESKAPELPPITWAFPSALSISMIPSTKGTAYKPSYTETCQGLTHCRNSSQVVTSSVDSLSLYIGGDDSHASDIPCTSTPSDQQGIALAAKPASKEFSASQEAKAENLKALQQYLQGLTADSVKFDKWRDASGQS
ncbi:hypothetical protein QFC24_006318 [Naganishia onofrii]|uniref:Uncharacterized protein n=1 Tax=Naganishia onofrii TaxID=1851511 RepID=A0ACC2X4R2_9TREE|nr:hypothetical protein QFC24_006318 [Naganishia onofrii]